MTAGTANSIPAQGPAAPTSNMIRRERGGDFILMKAPNVPMMNTEGNGAGMKKGSVTFTLLRRAVM